MWGIIRGRVPPGAELEVARTSDRLARYVGGAGEGTVSYRARLFRYDGAQLRHRLQIQELDPTTGEVVATRTVFDGRFDELEEVYRRLIRDAYRTYFREAFEAAGRVLPEDVLDQHVDRACREPGYAQTFTPKASWDWGIGVSLANLERAVFAAGFSMGTTAALDLVVTGSVSVERTLKVGALRGTSTFVGLAVGNQVTAALHTPMMEGLINCLPMASMSRSMTAAAVGEMAGGLGLALVWAYGGLLLGLNDLKRANREAVAQSAGAIGATSAVQGALGIAGKWGLASTGTEIATLTGGAKFNASVAWIGKVVLGKQSMAAGGLVLGAAAGVATFGLIVGVKGIQHLLDERDRWRWVNGHVLLAERGGE